MLAQETSVVRLSDRLDMTIAVDWDVKPQTKQNLDGPFSKLYNDFNSMQSLKIFFFDLPNLKKNAMVQV